MMRALSIACLVAGPVFAQAAGPPAPVAARRTPAEQAIALADQERARGATRGCAPTRGDEVVVCGNGRSPYRLPLPDERGPRRLAGEAARATAGGPPVGHGGMAGVTVNLLALAGAAAGTGDHGKIVTPGDKDAAPH